MEKRNIPEVRIIKKNNVHKVKRLVSVEIVDLIASGKNEDTQTVCFI